MRDQGELTTAEETLIANCRSGNPTWLEDGEVPAGPSDARSIRADLLRQLLCVTDLVPKAHSALDDHCTGGLTRPFVPLDPVGDIVKACQLAKECFGMRKGEWWAF